VVKARAIQNVKAEPTDKVNTWPHLMIAEFTALLAMTALLLVMSVVLHAPLLEPANFNATPNPSKAPWYFLGLQELLSYFDPQIAGVTVPTIIGLVGFMMIPYIDRNPSTKPSDRKFAIMLYTIFLTGIRHPQHHRRVVPRPGVQLRLPVARWNLFRRLEGLGPVRTRRWRTLMTPEVICA
jgi:quinol-cytochrome oxidoreductase complex cytochrome b subunit